MLTPRGFSLVELLVALSLGGVLLAVAGASVLRQQHGTRIAEGLAGAELQVRPALRIVGEELEPLDAAAGDLAAGQATDSSLQLRAVVAASLTCDSASAITLVPEWGASPPFGGAARAPVPGDSLWVYRGDSLGWEARSIVGVARPSVSCGVPTASAAPAWRLVPDRPVGVPAATAVRVTRWERWVVYRASDGRTYLGVRDWGPSVSRFLAAQPLAGPFVRTSAGMRTGFRYFDAFGAELQPDGTNERAIARVRVTALSLVPRTSGDSVRRDSADAVLARRGAA